MVMVGEKLRNRKRTMTNVFKRLGDNVCPILTTLLVHTIARLTHVSLFSYLKPTIKHFIPVPSVLDFAVHIPPFLTNVIFTWYAALYFVYYNEPFLFPFTISTVVYLKDVVA